MFQLANPTALLFLTDFCLVLGRIKLPLYMADLLGQFDILLRLLGLILLQAADMNILLTNAPVLLSDHLSRALTILKNLFKRRFKRINSLPYLGIFWRQHCCLFRQQADTALSSDEE